MRYPIKKLMKKENINSLEEYCIKHNILIGHKCVDEYIYTNRLHCRLCGKQLPFRFVTNNLINVGFCSCAKSHGKCYISLDKLETVYDPLVVDLNLFLKKVNSNKTRGLHTSEIQKQNSLKFQKKRKENPELYNSICSNQINFWIKNGYSLDEAKQLVKKRQTTFSLEKCIEKYGENEGLKRFRERQEKWQNTLKSKSQEEIDKINASKSVKRSYIKKYGEIEGLKKFIEFEKNISRNSRKSYSKVSQELFNLLSIELSKITNNIECIYATSNLEYCSNSEFCIDTETSFFMLDFYIPQLKKCIEFDGKYWHNSILAQQRDNKKTNTILSNGIKLLRVKEESYYKNKQFIIDYCIKWILDENCSNLQII